MSDWSGHDGAATAARYLDMAHTGFGRLSPSYAALSRGVAGDADLLRRLDTLPPPKRQPNLLFAAVRFLDGPVGSYAEFRSFVLGDWAQVSATMAARSTQTNEPRRCATMLPALTALPQPLALLEIGASAGLCLLPDHYGYRYDDRPVLGSSELILDCATRGPVPIPHTLPSVVWRAGLDLNPLDVTKDEDLRWLQALIWPEETARFDILRRAVAIARRERSKVHRGDLTTALAGLARSAPRSATLVVFHSAVLAYLDQAGRAALREQVAEVRQDRPVVWLSNESPGVVVDKSVAPEWGGFVLARDETPIALTEGHGNSVEWLAV